MSIATVGLDIAKHIFRVHGVDETGKVVVRRSLRRGHVETFFSDPPPCLVGLEACATAHYTDSIMARGHKRRTQKGRTHDRSQLRRQIRSFSSHRGGRPHMTVPTNINRFNVSARILPTLISIGTVPASQFYF